MVSEPRYAGFLTRLFAWFLDFLLNVFVVIGVFIVVMLSFTVIISPNMQEELLSGSLDGALDILLYCIGIITWWLYFACMESSRYQATLGKMVCGLIVVDQLGQRLSFGQATGRHFAKILSALPLNVGFLWIIFSKTKQGWHDEIAGTYVVKASADLDP